MPSHLRLKFVVGALLALTSALPAADAAADSSLPAADVVRDQLAEGVKEYRAGRPKAAALAFQRALALEPDNKILFQFYQAAGDNLLIQMERYDELDGVLKDVLRRARVYQRDLRQQPEFIATLMGKVESGSEEERVVASQELVAIGPMAVPALIARLGDNRQDEMRTYLRVTLTRMGYRAVLPLCEVLKSSDGKLVSSAAAILGDIGDIRALPHLVRAGALQADDTTKAVCAAAITLVTNRNGVSQTGSLDDLLLAEASRYLAGNDLVRDEQHANQSLAWRLDSESGKLVHTRVPDYAWNEVVAEQLTFDGLTANPENPAFQPMLAAILAASIAEPAQRLQIAKERTVPAQRPEDSPEALAERVKSLADQPLRLRALGAEALLRGIQVAVGAQRPEAAVILLRELEDRALAQPERTLAATDGSAGRILISLLDHADKRLRYQAAITLAHLDPALEYAGADKVGKILADAVGESGTRVVLVVDQDYRSRNAARSALQSKGFLVMTAVDGFEALQRLEETPAKDAIIIAGTLLPTIKDEHGALIDVAEQKADTLVAKLRTDWRAEKTPIFISLPEAGDAGQAIQKTFDGKVTGFVRKPFDAVDLQGRIDEALKGADLPNANREAAEDIALRAAVALQKPDARRTRIDLAVAADALIGTLANRADSLRIEALRALGKSTAAKGGDVVRGRVANLTDVYGAQDGQLTPALRAAFIEAIGQLDPTTEAAFSILERATIHEDPAVKAAAYAAIGHAVALKPALSNRIQLQRRLDVRDAGAGTTTP